jgi:hypothetical protein
MGDNTYQRLFAICFKTVKEFEAAFFDFSISGWKKKFRPSFKNLKRLRKRYINTSLEGNYLFFVYRSTPIHRSLIG